MKSNLWKDFERYPEMYRILDCINSGCNNSGGFPDYRGYSSEPELCQCEFCYADPASIFNRYLWV